MRDRVVTTVLVLCNEAYALLLAAILYLPISFELVRVGVGAINVGI